MNSGKSLGDVGGVQVGRDRRQFQRVRDARVCTPTGGVFVQLDVELLRQRAARFEHQLGRVEFERVHRRARVERAAGDHQFYGEKHLCVVLFVEAAGTQDAEGFLDAGAFIAADAGEKMRHFTLAQIVGGGEQGQQEPVAQTQRIQTNRVDQTLQARTENLEDMAFVVICVEILAPGAVAEREAAERDQHRIFGAGHLRRVASRADQCRETFAPVREQLEHLRIAFADQAPCRGRIRHPLLDLVGQKLLGITEDQGARILPWRVYRDVPGAALDGAQAVKRTRLSRDSLDQSARGQRDRRAVSDNEMIEYAYLDQGQRALELSRDGAVGLARFAHTGWMVVRKITTAAAL